MRPMTEAEFTRNIGEGKSQLVVIDCLIEFHRSHGHDEIVRVIENLWVTAEETLLGDEGNCEPDEDVVKDEATEDGGGI